ncbi:chloride channel protein [Pseudoalteromonas denitrificans]|uniref:chloride channel protein n=1 Tax=Pseudoalteromonas denitrificans TaxID=43656 RepID=UPI000B80EDE0|nr:chloride channel protein [Pseudoalteromonas denitrificans]
MTNKSLEALRKSLSKPKTSAQLCVLGIISGFVAALLIIFFRLLIIGVQALFLSDTDDFSQLPELHRLFIPVIGALLIFMFAALSRYKHYRLGVPFIIHRIKQNYGNIPFNSSLNQFFGGAIALISGFTVGREGPSVHIGAAGASFIGSKLHLPNNAMRTLAGCGVAAGISASFNTPLAAVIFVMEVVLREYKIHIFVPIILAAVTGAVTTQFVFGNTYELSLINVHPLPIWHYPYLILCGLTLGAIAYAFNQNLMYVIKVFKNISMFPRLLLAGTVMGLISFLVPQAMGSGMSAIGLSVISADNLQLLTTILIAKLLATLFILGLGIPGGIIGSVFGLGVIIGTLMSYFGSYMSPDINVVGTYAVIGMAGLFAATLHAPLAALVAVMEMTSSAHITVPAMIVITTAYVSALQFFGNRSIFLQQLDFQRLPYQVSPAIEALQKIGVMSEMDENFKLLYSDDKDQINETLNTVTSDTQNQTPLIVFDDDNGYRLAEYDLSLMSDNALPIHYIELQGISSQSTLADVFNILKDKRSSSVYIYNQLDNKQIMGLIRWDNIHHILTIRNSLV